jgi:Glycosyl hydrolase family 3 C-terminal domain
MIVDTKTILGSPTDEQVLFAVSGGSLGNCWQYVMSKPAADAFTVLCVPPQSESGPRLQYDDGVRIGSVLFGEVNPSAKLPMTFPRSVADLPHPHLVTPPPGATGKEAVQKTGEAKPTFSVHYDEGVKVGYKWYDAEHKPVLFPFGYGLSYTSYRYSGLKLGEGSDRSATFTVTNTGDRAGGWWAGRALR